MPTGNGESSREEVSENLPERVDVEPVADDEKIATRLLRIMKATEWFDQPSVEVDEGVVFIGGTVDIERHREWIGQLAGKTESVVAVVNRVQVREKPFLDFSESWEEIRNLCKAFIRELPLIVVSLVVFILTWILVRWAASLSDSLLKRRFKNQILRSVAVKAIAVGLFVLGFYFVLRISGLTRLAVTLLSGTGVLGLIIGFAFRDIAENFLASILISVQRPFAMGDVVKIEDHLGIIQSVNTRSTLMMTFEGNHVQIPNTIIYKNVIINYTANPKARFDFMVGIGYDDLITEAQEVAMGVLKAHKAVLENPEPMILVEQLAASTVNMRFYFWVDISIHDGLKVKSSVIRLTKVALTEAGISMPDEAREVVFPGGVPVKMIDSLEDAKPPKPPRDRAEPKMVSKEKAEVTEAEGDLANDEHEIRKQAEKSRNPEGGGNLLENNKSGTNG
ncbi:MAG: mechanosensitive ion channel family protein [Sumerlaeia bacterium]